MEQKDKVIQYEKHIVEGDNQFTAWCECGDSLRVVECLDDEDIIICHKYYCFGCNQYYHLRKLREIETAGTFIEEIKCDKAEQTTKRKQNETKL